MRRRRPLAHHQGPSDGSEAPIVKKLLVAALVVTAGALSIAGGGVGIALVDPNPTYGERIFLSLEGGGLTKHTSDTIQLTCTQDGIVVSQQSSTAAGYGAYFLLGDKPEWKNAPALCTAELLKATRKGWQVEDSLTFNVAA
jgi:hypothetical protein